MFVAEGWPQALIVPLFVVGFAYAIFIVMYFPPTDLVRASRLRRREYRLARFAIFSLLLLVGVAIGLSKLDVSSRSTICHYAP